MPEEIGVILDNLQSVNSVKFGDLELFSGKYNVNNSKEILITTAWSGWGKVSAARATTRLLSSNFNSVPIELAIFTGVAGAVDKNLKKWDVVISDAVIQHDMDARPLFEKYVVPAVKDKKISPNSDLLHTILDKLKKELDKEMPSKFGSVYSGLIATGDMFISDRRKIKQLSVEIPGLSAVEMEGAAFAQVAFQEKVDWMVLRVISDEANENASSDFNEFLNEYKYKSFDLIKSLLKTLLK